MKLKLKISGIIDNKFKSITRTVNCPDFVDREVGFNESMLGEAAKSLNGFHWKETVLNQQKAWLFDNYESIVIPLAEEAFMYPIRDAEIVPSKSKVRKIDQVLEAVSPYMIDNSEEFKAMFIGSLHEHWDTIKGLSIDKIIKITFETMGTSAIVSAAHLKDMMRALNHGDDIVNTLKS